MWRNSWPDGDTVHYCAAQRIGPLLEYLDLAQSQIEKEVSSTTDNPLIDMHSEPTRLYDGGNFQGSSIASVTEKDRSALQLELPLRDSLDDSLLATSCGQRPQRARPLSEKHRRRPRNRARSTDAAASPLALEPRGIPCSQRRTVDEYRTFRGRVVSWCGAWLASGWWCFENF